jgi:hypothetical protein
MGSKIFMLNKDEMGSVFEETAYQEIEIFGEHNEAALQYCLENFPELIPATQIDSEKPPKFVSIKSEAGVTAGSIDILLLDSNAVLNIVETKLYQNREIRRAVLGQAFEYAAYVALEWDATKIRDEGKSYWRKKDKDFEEIVTKELVGQDGSIEQFWAKLQSNIDDMKIRIIIVADKVPKELRQVIEFVNENSKFEIYALEIKLFEDKDGKKVLVPCIYGAGERRKGVGLSDKTEWLPEKLKEEIGKLGNDVRCKRFLEMLDTCLALDAFGGKMKPAFRFLNKDGDSCFNFYCNGKIKVHLQPRFYGDEEKMNLFLEQLNKIKIFDFTQTDIGHSRLAKGLLEELTDTEFQEFKELVKKVYVKGF